MSSSVFQANPRTANADLTDAGSDFLWAVFAVMFATGLGTSAWLITVPGM